MINPDLFERNKKVSSDEVSNVDLNDPNVLNYLVLKVRKKKNLVALLIPSVLLVAVIAAGSWGYLSFVQPIYDGQKEAKQNVENTLTSLEGYTVTEKTVKDDCLELTVTNPEDKDIKSLCAPEVLFNANEVGQPYVYVDVNKTQ